MIIRLTILRIIWRVMFAYSIKDCRIILSPVIFLINCQILRVQTKLIHSITKHSLMTFWDKLIIVISNTNRWWFKKTILISENKNSNNKTSTTCRHHQRAQLKIWEVRFSQRWNKSWPVSSKLNSKTSISLLLISLKLWLEIRTEKSYLKSYRNSWLREFHIKFT